MPLIMFVSSSFNTYVNLPKKTSYTRKSKLIKEKKGAAARKPNQINWVLFSQVMCGKTILVLVYVIFISLYFGLYLDLIVRGPHISQYKRSIRVYFNLESV